MFGCTRAISLFPFLAFATLCEVVIVDATTCMTDFEDGDSLHFVCFCNDDMNNLTSAPTNVFNDKAFSLAHFAYNLAGNYYSKAVHLTFQGCRRLRLVLDHGDLISEVGEEATSLFRADIQIKRVAIIQVYHLELLRRSKEVKTPKNNHRLIAFPTDTLHISLEGVALAKVDAGASFKLLETAPISYNNMRLYIDLREGNLGDEVNFRLKGFKFFNIFFISNFRMVVRLNRVIKRHLKHVTQASFSLYTTTAFREKMSKSG